MKDARALVDHETRDDAAVYQLSATEAIVETVDFFTPVVDDPYWFGRIAAANAFSDVWAMGGRPIFALNLVAFPVKLLPLEILAEILRGGSEAAALAGAPILGGHSIDDPEPKYGMVVTGVVHPDKVLRNVGAQPGDVLFLTKPLGSGILTTAIKRGDLSADEQGVVVETMARLNRDGADAMIAVGVHAATDVTGFGLAGHLVEMMRGSGVSAVVDLEKLPVFGAVADCLANDILSGAIERNAEYAGAWVQADDPHAKALAVLYDPQTSGGLLVALAPGQVKRFVAEMKSRGHVATSVIGGIIARTGRKGAEGRVFVRNSQLRNLIGRRDGVLPKQRAGRAGARRAAP